MRLKLTYRPEHHNMIIPFNTNDFVTGYIYRSIKSASSVHAKWLHDVGFTLDYRKFKFFTFSRLIIPNRRLVHSGLKVLSPNIYLYISMLMPRTLENFVTGMFADQTLYLGTKDENLLLVSTEVLPDPEFKQRMKFRTLSPIRCSIKSPDGRRTPKYLLPGDNELPSRLRENILNKYRTHYRKKPENDSFNFEFDEKYVNDRGGFKRMTSLITLKQGKPEQTKNRVFDAHFYLSGNSE
ncbi:MAG: CRISPR-associated endoribonuclease Cas6, partial [Candidatus Neomarinimicrobiota bacterium]